MLQDKRGFMGTWLTSRSKFSQINVD